MISNSPGRLWHALGLILLCHIYFFQIYPHFVFTNEKTRFLLVSAIVDYGTVQIDEPIRQWGSSQDKSTFEGRLYCDKAIGTSLLGIPVYLLLKPVGRILSISWTVELLILMLRIFCVTLPAILFAFPLTKLWKSFPINQSLIPHFLFLFLFGTIAFPNSLQYISHHIEGIFFFMSFYFAFQHKQNPDAPGSYLLLSGIFSGLALITEYPAVFPVFAIFLYLLWILPARMNAGWFIAGAVPFVAAALFYNYLIFGTPFDVTYRHQFDTWHATEHAKGFIGLSLPQPHAIWGLLFSRSRGLFFFSPFLLFAIPGLYYLVRDPRWRKEGLLFCFIVIAYTFFHSGFSMWHAGWALGPRYLAAVVPFLVTAAVFFFAQPRFQNNRTAGFLLAASGLFSVLVVTIGTATFPFPDQNVRDPLYALFLPFLLAGAGSLNMGNWLGMGGLSSILVFYVILLSTYLVMVLPDGELRIPQQSTIRRWALAVAAVAAWMVAGSLISPRQTSFDCYARGSNMYFLGRYEEAAADLIEAMALQPDRQMQELILSRMRLVAGARRAMPAAGSSNTGR